MDCSKIDANSHKLDLARLGMKDFRQWLRGSDKAVSGSSFSNAKAYQSSMSTLGQAGFPPTLNAPHPIPHQPEP
jgi:hypothetical protein